MNRNTKGNRGTERQRDKTARHRDTGTQGRRGKGTGQRGRGDAGTQGQNT